LWGFGVKTRKPQHLKEGLGAGGDLPEGLNPYPEIIPAGKESRQDGDAIGQKMSSSKSLKAPLDEPFSLSECGLTALIIAKMNARTCWCSSL
jgi:hypothetical protein